MEADLAELSAQLKRDEAELERLVSEWRNYKAGWINGVIIGFVLGVAVVMSLFAYLM